MRVAFFDCFAGASGDMILGALLDAGVSLDDIEAELARLDLAGYRMEVRRVNRCGVEATKVDVLVDGHMADSQFTEVPPGEAGARGPDADHSHDHGHQHHSIRGHDHAHHEHRPLRVILDLLDGSGLTPQVRDLARRIFLRLGRAESRVHGVPLESVHFHEVGGTDAIVDIVAAAAGFHLLRHERVVVSPIHIGSGFVRTAHGLYPVPAPATAFLLEGAPVYSTQIRGELITPTGAAILAEVAGEFGPLPPLTVTRVGYGAGTRDREIPNVIRLVLGETTAGTPTLEQVTELMANIDDMNPQFFDHLMDRLMGAGALDVWMAPVHMKKNRPGVVLHILCLPDGADRLTEIVLAESTSLGVRRRHLERAALERELMPVETTWGTVKVKVATQGGKVFNLAPEYEDCRSLAREHGVPLKTVHAAARAAAEHLRPK